MPPVKKSDRAATKVFRCSGYGNCQMAFTRSEHLARHIRMHTGEKPFECVISGCNRKFTRYDNMMQHTRTHERQKKKPVGDAAVCSDAPVATRTFTDPTEDAEPPTTTTAPPVRSKYQRKKPVGNVTVRAAAATTSVRAPTEASEPTVVMTPLVRPKPQRAIPTYGTTPCAVSTATASSFSAAVPVAEPTTTMSPPGLPENVDGNGNKSIMKVANLLLPQATPEVQAKQAQNHQLQHEQYVIFPSHTSVYSLPPPWQQLQHCCDQNAPVTATRTTLSPSRNPTESLEQQAVCGTAFAPVKRTRQSSEESRKRRRTSHEDSSNLRRLSQLDLETPIGCWSEHSGSDDSEVSTPVTEVTLDEYEAILAFGLITKSQTP